MIWSAPAERSGDGALDLMIQLVSYLSAKAMRR